jgi:hypothetical protein
MVQQVLSNLTRAAILIGHAEFFASATLILPSNEIQTSMTIYQPVAPTVSSAILERVSALVNESEEFWLPTEKGACCAVKSSPNHFLVDLLFSRRIPVL